MESGEMAMTWGHKDVRLLGKSREMSQDRVRNDVRSQVKPGEKASRVCKDVRLPGKSGKMCKFRARNDVTLLWKSGEMTIVKVRKEVRLLGKWLQ
jgi:hypothetical protein